MKRFLLWVITIAIAAIILLAGVPLVVGFLFIHGGSFLSGAAPEEPRLVSLIRLEGMILDSKETLARLYEHANDERVKGIVLRIDSPGGAVGPSQEIYSAVKRLKEKKPIVVSMGATAASGGLYAALGASKILAQPGTITGSIGVILQMPNVERISQMVGFDMVTVKSGALKDVGNPFRSMTEEERAFVQNTVQVAWKDFVQAVVDGRKLSEEQVLPFADGRLILGVQAKELGLIDGFGDPMDAARAVFEILGDPLKDDEQPTLYEPGEKFHVFRSFMESATLLRRYISGSTLQLQYLAR